MAESITYNGHVLTPASRQRGKPPTWTLEVHIMAEGRRAGVRRCRAGNRYATEELAVARCYEFGRRIVDGKMIPRPKGKPS
ncbi:MAG: hypothetical protein HY700_21460 [Gemmatimonadetes bacterium]|nr:hypothetical protein [Gemmatimonadota bacterium]